MPNNRVPKRPFFGEVKALILRGLCPPGLSRSGLIDVALPDFKKCQIGKLYRDAQDRLLGETRSVLHVPSSS